MFDMEARRIIEALRSGVPSRAVGHYFSEARPQIMRDIAEQMEAVTSDGVSRGRIFSGKYGEGKTHLLNTVYGMAHADQKVVSYLSISKESPIDKLYLIYQKVVQNTYLPGREQPGFERIFEEMSPNSPLANEMLAYAAKELETDKLYYVLRAYLNTDDPEEKFQLISDMEGDFIGNPVLRRIYRRIFNTAVKFNVNFSKTKHSMDYFKFISHLFSQCGYNGWVLLFDEAELIGRFGKKARQKCYRNIAAFLAPQERLENTFSLFAISSSYVEDVIDGKHEFDNLMETFPDDPKPGENVLNAIIKAPQLLPLTKEEIAHTVERMCEFHGKAYDWTPGVSTEEILKATRAGGYLLRTQIRAAIEYLDQTYQYGAAGETQIEELSKESFEEVPSLEDVL